MKSTALLASLVACFALWPALSLGQIQQADTVTSSEITLDQIMAVPARSIPEALLRNAEGIAIIPKLIKAGFVIGGRRGHGVVTVRTQDGWSNPIFVTLTGGSIGWQAGIQSTDVILVFKTRKSVDGFLNGDKLTLTADAGLAVGPLGRQAAVGTDLKLNAEIYSYCRSRGLFAGVAVEGAVIRVDGNANAAYYQRPTTPADIILGNGVVTPQSALQLRAKLAQYTGVAQLVPVPAPAAAPTPAIAPAPVAPAPQLVPQLAPALPGPVVQ
jgi:lipid-binding SYLF domain-containing protein